MIYLFAGDDTKNKLAGYEKFIKSIGVGTEKISINRNNFSPFQFENFYSSTGLFFTTSAITLTDILEREETREFILKNLDKLKDSENSFIFVERKLGKPVVDAFKKQKAEVYIFELPKEKKEKFNNFLLANAFEAKDKLHLWIYYRQAVEKGVGLEELVGVLFWKMKDMILKNNFRVYPKERLQTLTSKLPYLLPEARSKGRDAEIAFEQFLLEAF